MTVVLTLRRDADPARVQAELQGLGAWATPVAGAGGARAFALAPGSAAVSLDRLAAVEGVADVLAPRSPHPRLDAQAGRPVEIAPGLLVGGGAPPVLAAGPCGVETELQIHEAAALAARAGAALLRGGAFKPRTSPYAFAGHGEPALRWLREAADAHGLAVVTEALSEADVDAVAEVADLVQVGARHMQAFALLRALGRAGKPLLLKRGMAATLEEWRLAAEHALDAGAPAVVFCERGLAGVDPETRNVLDLGAVALMKHVYRQPVLADPSHACGRRDLVVPLGRAALAAGADGLLVEAHPDARAARSDGPQALDEEGLRALAAAFPARGASPRGRAASGGGR